MWLIKFSKSLYAGKISGVNVLARREFAFRMASQAEAEAALIRFNMLWGVSLTLCMEVAYGVEVMPVDDDAPGVSTAVVLVEDSPSD